MNLSVSTEKYNGVARTLHWIIAILIIFNLLTGFFHNALEGSLDVMPLHMSFGLTVLVLSVVRLLWRMTWTRPPYPPSVTAFQRKASSLVHGLLYVMMLVMPISGWIMVSAGKNPPSYFGLFDVPTLDLTRDSTLWGIGHEGHEIGGWIMLILAAGHIGAALYHQFVMKDRLINRMI